ncbi:RcnB family protein [Variovorax sp. J22P271]|uniref:RcnB family protein n=1 Tax=Variovorax davisae TaxID=3053515 RepID=UPI002578140F|nr:RcnB family protein [Variovorax sp. J22P271]MDM0036680.1 RcnB family protein [Variovorax sp. J22P271]
MIKSKSMAAAAAALAMCMAGSAFAQDRRFDRGPDRDDRAQSGHHADARPDYRPGPHYRPDPRSAYRPGPARFDHRAYPNPHAEWRRGGRVPNEYRGRQYVVNDWRGHRLQPPPRGYQWMGVGGDFVLAAAATGLIAQIVIGQ